MASSAVNKIRIIGRKSLKDFLKKFSENDQEKYEVEIEEWPHVYHSPFLRYELSQTPQEDIDYYNHICSASYPIEQIMEDACFKEAKKLEEFIYSFIYLAYKYPDRIRVTEVTAKPEEYFSSDGIFKILEAIDVAYPQETLEASSRLNSTKVKIQAYLDERNKKLARLLESFSACFPRSFMTNFHMFRNKPSSYSMEFAFGVGVALVAIPYLLLLSLVLMLSKEFRDDFLDRVKSRDTAFSKLSAVFHALFATSSLLKSILLGLFFLPGVILGGCVFLLLEAAISLGGVFRHLGYRMQFERQKAENEGKVGLALGEYFVKPLPTKEKVDSFFGFLKQCVYRPTARTAPSSSPPDAPDAATEAALAQHGEGGIPPVGFLALPVEIREAIAAKLYELNNADTPHFPYSKVGQCWDAIRSRRGEGATRIIANFEEDRLFAGTTVTSFSRSPSSQNN